MAEAMKGINGSLNTAVDGTRKEFAKAATKSRENAVSAIFGENGDRDPKHTFGRFLLAVRNHETKALDVHPDRHRRRLPRPHRVLPPHHAVGRRAVLHPPGTSVIPITAGQVQVPTIDVTTAPAAGDPAFLGGLVAR
jgi:hypothetical protein